ncbi:MAG TPA: winged helix DNA-binding domain-containing protein [Candidatus Dormibacteraeota bacterium]
MKEKPSVVAQLTWDQVHAFRLAGHHLATQASREDLVKVAGDIGGAQAQVMSAAELQIAVRTACSVTDVRNALWKKKSLVKTWLMRGTLHLVPARDLPLYTAAMRGRWMKPRPSWLRYFGLSEAELATLIDTIGGIMNGEPMTREEIIAVAGQGHSERVVEWLRSGWGGFLKPVARAGLLCFGPSRGQSVTFVSPKDWLGAWRQVDPEVALVEIARRYLRAFGPATKQDFTSWWGRWPGVGTAAWAGLEPELVEVSVGAWRAQMLAADLRRIPPRRKASVRLLPPFDPYLMGWASRDHMFEAVHRPKVSRTAGWISAVVLVDGRVEGTWTHTVAKGVLRVHVAPFQRLARATASEVRMRAVELAASLGRSEAEVEVAQEA